MADLPFQTLDDYDFNNKTVLCRVDLNCPLDPESQEFLDDRRIKKHAATVRELKEKGAKVVLLAHQGRPGAEYDFTTLEAHAAQLKKVLGNGVSYVPDIIGPAAQEKIKALKSGDVLLLENVRFLSEELLNRPADAQALTHFVKTLAPLADFYVNDAFAAAHRSQPSLVGFAQTLPSVAGRVMQQEIEKLSKAVTSAEKPRMFVAGGAKLRGSLKAIQQLLSLKKMDRILTGGLVANIFLVAKGYEIRGLEYIENYGRLVAKAERLLSEYGDQIEVPLDLAFDKYGKRLEASLSELPLPYRVSDIGSGTIEHYESIINEAGTVVVNGPMGVFEQKDFAKGTNTIVSAAAEAAYSVVGGGHSATAVAQLKLEEKISHVSTGGGACMAYLSGEELPAIQVLTQSAERNQKKVKQSSLTEKKQ